MEQTLINFFDNKHDFRSKLNIRSRHVVINSVKDVLRKLDVKTSLFQSNFYYSVYQNELTVDFHFDPSKENAGLVFAHLINIINSKDPYNNLYTIRQEINEPLKYRYEFWINMPRNDIFDISEFDEDSELGTQFILDDEWYLENRKSLTVTVSINNLKSNFLSFIFNLEEVTEKIEHILDKERFSITIENDALLWVMDKMTSLDTRPLRSFYFKGKIEENMMIDILEWLEENIGTDIKKTNNTNLYISDFNFFTLSIETNIYSLKSEFILRELESYFDCELFHEDESTEEKNERFIDDSNNKFNGFETREAFNDFYGIDDDSDYSDDDIYE